jgi:hypothetical protein
VHTRFRIGPANVHVRFQRHAIHQNQGRRRRRRKRKVRDVTTHKRKGNNKVTKEMSRERKISSGSIDEEWFEIQPRIYRKGKEEENGFFFSTDD